MTAGTAQAVELPRIVDLDAVEPLRERLLDALADGDVSVDGSAVERISTNALLLLLTAAQTVDADGSRFSLHNSSPTLTHAIARLGLAPAFAGIVS